MKQTYDQKEDGLVDLGDLLRGIWSDAWILVLITALFVAAGIYKAQTTTPTYWAQATIMLDGSELRLSASETAAPRFEVNEAVVANEVSVLGSNLMIEELVDALSIDEIPEFSQRTVSGGPIAKLQSALLGNQSNEVEVQMRTREQVIDQLQGSLSIRQIGISHGIRIGFVSQSSTLAADVPNTLANLYIDRRFRESLIQTKRASSLLAEQTATWRDEVAALEADLVEGRSDFAEMEHSNRALSEQVLLSVADELSKVRAERVALEARLESLRALRDIGENERLTGVIQSIEIDRIKESLAAAEILLRERAATLGSENTESKAVINQREAIDGLLLEEVESYLTALEDDLAIRLAHEDALGDQLRLATQANVQLEKASVELDQLELEAVAARGVYEGLLQRLNETRAEEAFGRSGVRLIEQADVPLAHAAPKKTLIALASLIAGIFVGLIVIVARQLLSNRVRSIREIESLTGHPILAVLPRVRPAVSILKGNRANPFGRKVSEEFRRLRNAVLSTPGNNGGATVCLVTSTSKRDGKSLVCQELAKFCVLADKRVLLIDANFREKAHWSSFSFGSAGLAEALESPDLVLDLVTQPDGISFSLLSAGQSRDRAIDVLTTENFEPVIRKLRPEFDIIVVDAPQVAGIADVAIFGQHTDVSVVVMDVKRTSRRALQANISTLADLKSTILGVVASRVTSQRRDIPNYG